MNHLPDNMSDVSSKNSIQIMNIQNKQSCIYHFPTVTKNPINFINNQRYIDQTFALKPSKDSSIKINRLSLVYPANTPLFIDLKTGKYLDRPTKQRTNVSHPSYLSQINILPFSHYCKIIEPAFVNDQGYYQVIVLKDGVLVKQIVDDTFYFEKRTNQILTHPQLQHFPWVHILIKVWAKLNSGYQNLSKCLPFQFIKTYSFPDWQLINPSKQKKQALIKRLTRATNKTQYVIAKTKNNQKVRYFGFTPNCASFVVIGHYQQYADIYIKIASFTYDRWNNFKSSSDTKSPQQMPKLQGNQFLMPLNEFENIFHLIYSTSNKYNPHIKKVDIPDLHFQAKVQSVTYNKFTLNVDARESNAIVVGLQVQTANDDYKFVQVGLCIYFPLIKTFDLVRGEKEKNQQGMVVPWCKLMIGRMHETTNLQASYMESVKEKMLDCGEDLISFVTHTSQHDFVAGSFFKGYANQLIHNLVLKTGKYLLRIKIEQKISQYRCFINTTAVNGRAKIFEPHVQPKQQVILLEDCLYKKAARDRQCITFVNPAKKGSWISFRDQYNVLGYSYVAVHVVKNADNKIVVSINPKKLKQQGYLVKGHKDMNEYTIVVDSEQNALIVIKYDKQWKKGSKRIWPPPGIEFTKVKRVKKQG